MIQQIIFWVITLVVFYTGTRQFMRVRRNILLGHHLPNSGVGSFSEKVTRLKNVLLIAFGQRKMFKNWLPAIFHLFIYVAFLFTQIELIEILLDGLLGFHRFFADKIGGLYNVVINSIEILSVLALVATVVFLARRNLLKISRFRKSEMKGWPTLDANTILLAEIVLIIGIFTMNGADYLLQEIYPNKYPPTGPLLMSSRIAPLLFGSLSNESLVFAERFGWWLHIIVVFGFLLYLPFSKHLHIILSFPNVYYADLNPKGKMPNMPEVMNEVKSMLGMVEETSSMEISDNIPEFGAKDVTGLSWKNILDAYSCTECGRCTAECPANITGKKLSPRKIMMDVRDRAEEVGSKLDTGSREYIHPDRVNEDIKLTKDNFYDGKSLFDYISKEEIHACTTCNACVEACPVLINPLSIILQLRRYEVLTESSGPSDLTSMFTSLENSGNVWQMPVEREAWIH